TMKQKFLLLSAIVCTAIFSLAFIPANHNSAPTTTLTQQPFIDGQFSLAYFESRGIDVTSEFPGYVFEFVKDGNVLISYDSGGTKGTWYQYNEDHVYLEFGEEKPVGLLTGKWFIQE